ncbi:hypothetical protein E2C01_027790 [Portunus trituberculatus]|uniref:Uncharacterized protein n=1 Tax=Portunus trituberculatus TaxID=210409 RepID=A0A5B7EN48_PORTR|nr:hypothetical protein [Portunus trituberculatus]
MAPSSPTRIINNSFTPTPMYTPLPPPPVSVGDTYGSMGGGGFGMTSTVCPIASSPNCLPAQQPPAHGHTGSPAGMGLARDNPHAPHNHYMTRPSYESLYSHARASPTCPPMLYHHHHHHQSPHAHEYNTPTPPNSQAGSAQQQGQNVLLKREKERLSPPIIFVSLGQSSEAVSSKVGNCISGDNCSPTAAQPPPPVLRVK